MSWDAGDAVLTGALTESGAAATAFATPNETSRCRRAASDRIWSSGFTPFFAVVAEGLRRGGEEAEPDADAEPDAVGCCC